MTVPSLLEEPGRVDEPQAAQGYSAVLTRVAVERRPLIVRRNGEDLAAVIPLEYLELVREVLRSRKSRNWARKLIGTRRAKLSAHPRSGSKATSQNPFEPKGTWG